MIHPKTFLFFLRSYSHWIYIIYNYFSRALLLPFLRIIFVTLSPLCCSCVESSDEQHRTEFLPRVTRLMARTYKDYIEDEHFYNPK